MSSGRFKSPFDGQNLRRHDGIVHIVHGATDNQASASGWWVLMMRCHKPAKYHATKDSHRRRWQNKLVESPANCMGCIAGSDATDGFVG